MKPHILNLRNSEAPLLPLADLGVVVGTRLMELTCTSFLRGADRTLSGLKSLSEVRDFPGFVDLQRELIQNFLEDQESAFKTAAQVLQDGMDEARALWREPTVDVVEVPARQEMDLGATAGATFEIYRDKAGEHRFRLKTSDGGVLLKSEGYKARSSAYNGVESVQKNATDDACYERRTTKSGRATFTLRARNHRVVGVSPAFSSPERMEAAIDLIKLTAAHAEVKV